MSGDKPEPALVRRHSDEPVEVESTGELFSLPGPDNQHSRVIESSDPCLKPFGRLVQKSPGSPINEPFAWSFSAAARAPFIYVSAAYLSPYLTSVSKFFASEETGKVTWLGIELQPSSYVFVFVTVAILCSAISLPFLGAATDYSHHRKSLLVTFNVIGSLAVIMMATLVQDSWFMAGFYYIIGFFCYYAALSYTYAFLPEIGEDVVERSKISKNGVVYSNGTGSTGTIIATILVLFLSSPQLELNSPDFESGDTFGWQVGINGSQYPCPFANSFGSCQSVKFDDLTGQYSLRLSLDATAISTTPAGVILRQISDQKASVYAGQEMLFFSNIKNTDGLSLPYTLRLVSELGSDSNSTASRVSPVYTTSGDYEQHFIKFDVPDDATSLSYEVALTDAGVYFMDDFQAFTEFDLIRPMVTALSGLWWFCANFVVFRNFNGRPASHPSLPGRGLCYMAVHQLKQTMSTALHSDNRNVLLFLLAHMLNNCGVAAISTAIAPFASEVLRVEPALIGAMLLLVQFSAVLGAVFFDFLGRTYLSWKTCLYIILVGWTVVTIFGGAVLRGPEQQGLTFVFSAFFGIFLGAIVSVPRAMYADFIRVGQEAEFMGLLSFFSQILSWLGPLQYAVINEATESQNDAFQSIAGFFVISILFLIPVEHKGLRGTKVVYDETPTARDGQDVQEADDGVELVQSNEDI